MDHNLNLLHQNDFNLTNLYNHQKKSAITYGLEFKMTSILEQLFKNHPRFNKLKLQLTEGVEFELEDMTDEMRKRGIREAFRQENHKSSLKNKKNLENALEKEIVKGWNIILPSNVFDVIPDLIQNPM